MARKPSVFDQLSALDALTGDSANDQDTTGTARWPKGEPQREAPAATPAPAAAQPDMNATIVAMLADIRRDIDTLKHEQPVVARRPQQPTESDLYGALSELKRDIDKLRYEQAAVHVPSTGEQQLYAMLAELRHDIGTLQGQTAPLSPRPAPRAAAADFGAAPRQASAEAMAQQRNMLAVLAAAVLMIGLPLVYLSWKNMSSSAQFNAPAPIASASSKAIGSSLYDALAVGDLSPKGVDARGTVPASALARATGAERNSDEAAFWLKRYISGPMGDDRVRRALTQLGSIYAEPAGQAAPDYEKARALWEMASAAGDPIAMCFLGQLYENGLGVTLSRPAAGTWYERARTAGGCPGIEDMIARTKK